MSSTEASSSPANHEDRGLSADEWLKVHAEEKADDLSYVLRDPPERSEVIDTDDTSGDLPLPTQGVSAAAIRGAALPEVPVGWKEIPNSDAPDGAVRPPRRPFELYYDTALKTGEVGDWERFKAGVERFLERNGAGAESLLPATIREAYFFGFPDTDSPKFGGDSLDGSPTFYIDDKGDVVPPYEVEREPDPPRIPGTDVDSPTLVDDQAA